MVRSGIAVILERHSIQSGLTGNDSFFSFPIKISFQLELRNSAQTPSVSDCLFGLYCFRLCPFQVPHPNVSF